MILANARCVLKEAILLHMNYAHFIIILFKGLPALSINGSGSVDTRNGPDLFIPVIHTKHQCRCL